MVFNSIQFVLFFPIVTLLYFLLPFKYRWFHLLIASCIFYMFFIPQYIFILFTTIVIDYIAGIWIEKSDNRKTKKRYLVISIISTCLVLFVFKYFDFFNENMLLLSHKFGFHYPEKTIHFILPIGLSFHTFQSLSYVIEVYKGKQKAEKHFGIYSLYVMFYPQLVTGPIERPQNLLVQLRQEKKFQYSNLSEGMRLILFGLFIKMVVADNLAVYVDQIYTDPTTHSTLSILTGLFFYSFQIYCDFYGYSSIAIGCARVMGYSLMDNFRTPYFSQSIGEFWHRWHISLSSWFRDYVYFSLGGNRVKLQRWVFNILVVFALSGLWHGAQWTFVIWGLAHGILLVLETLLNRVLGAGKDREVPQIRKFFQVIFTFTTVTFVWVLFRAKDMSQVSSVFKSVFQNVGLQDNFHVEPKIWFFLLCFIILDSFLVNKRFDLWCGKQKLVPRWSFYAIMIFLIIVQSNVDNFPFIYFQF